MIDSWPWRATASGGTGLGSRASEKAADVDQLKAKGPKHELCNVCSRYDPGNKEGFIQISNVLRDPEPAARPPEL